MSKTHKVATIFGGTGFVGRYLVRDLAARGMTVRIASRNPQKAYFLKTAGVVGQIVPEYCDYSDETSIGRAIQGSDYVINLVALLYEKKRGDFNRTHVELPKIIAKSCYYHEVERFVQVSSLGVDISKSNYAKTKFTGEQAVLMICENTVVIRPSLIFGPEDNFFNRFAGLANIFPALPLIGGGETNFQPIYVGDVAQSIANILALPEKKSSIYEIGGPQIFSFKEMMEKMFEYTEQPRPLIPLSWALSRMKAFALSIVPGEPILTQDQITSLHTDSVCTGNYPGTVELGIESRALDAILPQYLSRFKPGGRFGEKASSVG